jgi:hypothetical protein
MVRRVGNLSVARMRIASSTAAAPEALSMAPVTACQESIGAPNITTSSGLSLPGSSATSLAGLWPASNLVSTEMRT